MDGLRYFSNFESGFDYNLSRYQEMGVNTKTTEQWTKTPSLVNTLQWISTFKLKRLAEKEEQRNIHPVQTLAKDRGARERTLARSEQLSHMSRTKCEP